VTFVQKLSLEIDRNKHRERQVKDCGNMLKREEGRKHLKMCSVLRWL